MICALLFLFFAASAQANFNELNMEECLNYTLYPTQYELTIIPFISDQRSYYDCHMTITVIANAYNVQVIELAAKDLEIIGESIQVFDGIYDIVDTPRPYIYDKERGKLYIYLNKPLVPTKSIPPRSYTIKLSFRKEVSYDISKGVFIARYPDQDGHMRYFLQARFSPDNAKYFMPCFDDPRFDTGFKFVVYLMPTDRHVVRANTSLVIAEESMRKIRNDGMVEVHYNPSAQITLRELGFHYSDFKYIKVTSKYNDTIVIWAPEEEVKNCHFILDFGNMLVNVIHEYSTENHSLIQGPINIVAVPAELDGYEIDSWNLLTNNARRVIYRPEYMSITQREQMMFELAQQFSRIWLGSSGEHTKKTRWEAEWFKEGLATYLAYHFLNQLDRGIHSSKQRQSLGYYGIHMKHASMLQDWPHSTPALINFDKDLAVFFPKRYKELISIKTASLLWMVENWLGAEKFHQALIKYITTRRGGMKISLMDFYTSFDLSTKECFNEFFKGSTASKILDSWFRHPGYPVIEVSIMRAWENDAILLKQRRFSFINDNRHETSFQIPISYILQNITNCYNCYKPRFTMNAHTYTFKENLNNGWIILNRNASGYYRVNYDEQTWRLIAQTLKEDLDAIDELNRAQIVNDVIALYVAGDMPQHLAMSVLDYLDREESQAVWESVADAFQMFHIENAGCMMTKALYSEWQLFLRRKVAKIYDTLMDPVEWTPKDRRFRSRVAELACQVRYHKCLANMNQRYTLWRSNQKKRMEPDLRAACYYTEYDKGITVEELNSFEREDLHYAVNIRRRENHFLAKIPKGEPRPETYKMSTTEPMYSSTEKSALTGENHSPDGSHTLSAYLYMIILMAVINLLIVR